MFIILIDGINVAYQESGVFSDSRVITINFEQDDSKIEIIGTHVVTSKNPTTSSYFEDDSLETGCGKGSTYDPKTKWCIIENETPSHSNKIITLEDKNSKSQNDNTQLKTTSIANTSSLVFYYRIK